MSFITNSVDFMAKIDYISTNNGGRKSFAVSGYRPQIKFPFSEMMTTGEQSFIGQESVEPGQTVNANIKLLSPDFYKNKLEVGMSFKVVEGKQIVANGILIKIFNEDLLRNNN